MSRRWKPVDAIRGFSSVDVYFDRKPVISSEVSLKMSGSIQSISFSKGTEEEEFSTRAKLSRRVLETRSSRFDFRADDAPTKE
jgi:hypothetical protein